MRGDGDERAAATPGGCAVDFRILVAAIDAYRAEFSRLPDNEQALVDAGILRTTFEAYDVVYGEIVPGDRSPWDVPPS